MKHKICRWHSNAVLSTNNNKIGCVKNLGTSYFFYNSPLELSNGSLKRYAEEFASFNGELPRKFVQYILSIAINN